MRRLWQAVWPVVAAAAAVLAAWQLVAVSGWRPADLLPGPGPVLGRLGADARDPSFFLAIAVTLRRALAGYLLAVVAGGLVGALVARNRLLRRAFGALITGLQSMPSIAWFPFAILLFGLGEPAILFVVVMGAGPAVANGVIGGIDHVPPLLLRTGRALGARGPSLYRHVVLPAALPAFLGGLKQGWAFAWRSLMAGELLAVAGSHLSLGGRLQLARQLSDARGLLATMLVVLVIGMLVDGAFALAQREVRSHRGLLAD